jgi:glutamyl-tRNA synthetase
LVERRKQAEKEGKPPKYDRRCRRLPVDEVNRKVEAGELHALRFAVPEEGVSAFEDEVFGRVEVAVEEIEDFVLARNDGHPTYHLGVVADDVDMRVTHVIRGADHISNTHKQALLYGALGEKLPVFAHVPLILGADRTRMSKRHGATSVIAYKEEGFVPEAFRNFLALLGWSPGDDTELMHTKELIKRFSLGQVSRSNAVFDRDKLEWFNGEYLRNDPLEKVLPLVEEELRGQGLWDDAFAGERKQWFAEAVEMLRPRVRLLRDFSTWSRAWFTEDFEYDPAAVKKFLTKEERLPQLLGECRDEMEKVEDWTHDPIETAVRGVAEKNGIKAGVLINAVRVALVGQRVAPPLFNMMAMLGRERVVDRLGRLVTGFAGVVAGVQG